MANKVIITFIALDVVFLTMACLILAMAIVFSPDGLTMNIAGDAALDMLLQESPLNAAFANAGLMFATFLLSIPAIISTKPIVMRIFTYMVIVCAALTLAVSLDLWFTTLATNANLSAEWMTQSPMRQSMIQDQFQCCGFFNATTPSAFPVNDICTDPATAQRLGGCSKLLSTYASHILGIVFTAMFGIVGIDVMVFLSGVVVIKDRAEKERYRLIDQKVGVGGI